MASTRPRPRLRALLAAAGLTAGVILAPPSGGLVQADPTVPDPRINALMGPAGYGNGATGEDWTLDVDGGVVVDLFDDPAAEPLSTTHVFPEPDSGDQFFADIGIYEPGHLIRATGQDSGTVREVIVDDLRVTGVDRFTGIVTGTTTVAEPLNVQAYVPGTGNLGHPSENSIRRVATKTETAPGSGLYTWDVDFSLPPGAGESGTALSLPIDFLAGRVDPERPDAGVTTVDYSGPRIRASSSNGLWLTVENIDENARIEFDRGADHFVTEILTPFHGEFGGRLHPDLHGVESNGVSLLDAWGDGAGWTVTVVATDGSTILAQVELPLLTLDSVDTATPQITGRADIGLFINVDAGGHDGWDSTQFEVTTSPWQWPEHPTDPATAITVADRNITALWDTLGGYGHELGVFYPWPSFTYSRDFDEIDGGEHHRLSSFGGAPLGSRGNFPFPATVSIDIDDPSTQDDPDHTLTVATFEFPEEGVGSGFEVDLVEALGIVPDDVAPGWTFTASTDIDGIPMSKTLVVDQVSVDAVDLAAGSASGTCTPDEFEWIVQVGRGDPSFGWSEGFRPPCIADLTDPTVGTWSISFDPDQPAPVSYVWASYQDGDLDVNTAAWYVPVPSEAFFTVRPSHIEHGPTTNGKIAYQRCHSHFLPCATFVSEGLPLSDTDPDLGIRGEGHDWSADGSRLVYEEGFSISIVDGTGLPIADDIATGEYPTLSPDGAQVAFELGADNSWEIHRVDDDAQGLTNLTNHPARDRHPDWSPNGDRIAFASDRSGRSQIWTMNTDGSDPAMLTDLELGATFPAWSADGSQIAFLSKPVGGSGTSDNVIWIADADGANATQMGTVEARGRPAWAPDGSSIIFYSYRSTPRGIYQIDLAGGGAQDYVDCTIPWNPVCGGYDPAWQPLPGDIEHAEPAQVRGEGFDPDASLDILVNGEHAATVFTDGDGWFDSWLDGGPWIVPGDLVEIQENGSTVKDHAVVDVGVDEIDADSATLAGHAPPFATVDVNGPGVHRTIVADGSGQWFADFTVPGVEDYEQDTIDGFGPGSGGSAEVRDENGDGTQADWCFECGGPGGGEYEVVAEGFAGPHQIAFDPDGNMLVTDEVGGTVWKTTFGPDGETTEFATLNGPSGIAFSPDGVLHVSDDDNRVVSFDVDGIESVVLDESDGLHNPNAIAFGADGDLFIANAGSGWISKLSSVGTFTLELTGGFQLPQGLVVHDSGNLWVGDVTGTITEVDPNDGTRSTVLETGNGNDGGLAFHSDEQAFYAPSLGDDGIVLRVVEEPFTVEDCLGGLQYPIGVTVGPDGWIYVADYGAGQILRANGCFGGGGPGDDEPPVIQANITEEWLQGERFADGSTLLIDLHDTDGQLVIGDPGQGDHTWVIDAEEGGYFFVPLHESESELHLGPGMEIVVNDGVNDEKRLTLVDVRFDSFDPAGNVVAGYAPDLPIGEARLHLVDQDYEPMWNDEEQPIKLFPGDDFDGDHWSYDLGNPLGKEGVPSYDPDGLVEARVEIPDGDGDGTFASMPLFWVVPPHTVTSSDFDGHATVTVEIFDEGAWIDPIVVDVGPRGDFGVPTEEYDVELDAGDEVRVTGDPAVPTADGSPLVKHHRVLDLVVDHEGIDYDTDTVTGTVDAPFAWVILSTEVGEAFTQADETGAWTATLDDEGQDLEEGMHVAAWVEDPDRDRTFVEPTEPPPGPHIVAEPFREIVVAEFFPEGNELELIVEEEGQTVLGPLHATAEGERVEWFLLPDGFDLVPGHVVTVTDLTASQTELFRRELVVADIGVIEVDDAADVVRGTVDTPDDHPGVFVAAGTDDAGGGRFIEDDGTGTWEADFSGEVDIDKTRSWNLFIAVPDTEEDPADLTVFAMPEATPGLLVEPHLDVITAEGSGLGDITIRIPELGYEVTMAPDHPGGPAQVFPGFEFDIYALAGPEVYTYGIGIDLAGEIDLVPGMVVEASDPLWEMSMTVTEFSVDAVDSANDTVAGFNQLPDAPEGPGLVATFVSGPDAFGFGLPETEQWELTLTEWADGPGDPYDIVGTEVGLSFGTTTEDQPYDTYTAVLWDLRPHITSLELPLRPVEVGTDVALHATFTDLDVADSHSALIDWGDGETTVLDDTGTTIDEFHAYVAAGVYTVTLTVEDAVGNVATEIHEFVVAYDPGGGRVSGAGWYWSGPEAYADEHPWGGPARFGYRAKYRDGDDVPSGKTKLHLVGEFFFTSISYDYLIVNDTVAISEGIGKLDGDTGYRFRVQGIDNGCIDFFQITIWDDATGEVLYDNGVLYDEGDLVLWGGIRIRT